MIKKKIDFKNSIIILLVESYIEFAKISIRLEPQKAFNKILEYEKTLLNFLPKDHIFFEIILQAKVCFYSLDLNTFESAVTNYEKLLKCIEKSSGKFS